MTGTNEWAPDHLGSHIGGSWVFGEKSVVDLNPARPDEIVARAYLADASILGRALDSTRAAADGWARTTGVTRAGFLTAAAGLVDERARAIATDLAREMGKSIGEAIGETRRAALVLRYFAAQALEPDGETYSSSSATTLLFGRRIPVGVVSVVTPWNFPIAIPAWKIAPALAYGNAVVWKPAELVPLTAVHLMQVFIDAGLPPGALNLVLGSGRELGDDLVADARVDAVTFTGSTPVGEHIRARTAHTGQRIQLEMGGKNPAVVLADADLDQAAHSIARAAFLSSGQKCTATSRVIVDAAVMTEFTDRLVAVADAMKVGDPLDETVDLGPVASAAQWSSINAHLELGLATGRRLTSREAVNDGGGHWVPPTVFVDLPADSPLMAEEIFGPVVTVQRAVGYEQCVAIANDTDFGLAASLYTTSLSSAMRFANDSSTGIVKVNQETSGVEPVAPFGGTKRSGYGTQEQGKAAREFFTHWKSVYIDHVR